MHKTKLLVVALVVGVFSALTWAGLAHAQTFRSNVDKNTTVDGSLYSAGRNIVINGTVNGDIYCAGENVVIDAVVHGDIICGAQDIVVSGQVDGDIRIAAQSLTVNARVAQNASLLGGKINVTDKAKIGRDLNVIGDSTVLAGAIGRDLMVNGDNARVASEIGRNTTFDGKSLVFDKQAKIGGGLSYTSPSAATIPSAVKITGETKHYTPAKPSSNSFLGLGVFHIVVLSMLVLFALALVMMFPQRVHEIAAEPTKRLGKTLLVGLLAGTGLPVVGLLLAFTLVGIPFGVFLLLFWALVALVSGPIAGYYLGSMILSKSKNPINIMLVGALVLVVLYMLPVVGVFFMFIAFWIGTGAVILHIKHHTPKPVYKVK